MKKFPASVILLITSDNSALLQQRDNNPNITNPGKIGVFGGLNEEGETPKQGALRELFEETSLTPSVDELSLFMGFTKDEENGTQTEVYVYLLKDVRSEDLVIHEGLGYYELKEKDNLDQVDLAKSTRIILEAYYKH